MRKKKTITVSFKITLITSLWFQFWIRLIRQLHFQNISSLITHRRVRGKHITYFLFVFLSLLITTCSFLWKPKTLTINYFFTTIAQINGILPENINITPPHWQHRHNLMIRERGHYLLGTG